MASALDSGLALLILALLGLERAGVVETGHELIAKLARLLTVFICVDAFFIGCELLTMGYPGAGEEEALAIMATGATAPFFWSELICGLLIPFLMLASDKRRQSYGVVAGASVLVVLGVLCKRIWLLLTSFVTVNVEGGSGVTLGTRAAQADPSAIWATGGTYAPTAIEVVIIVGVVSLGIIAFTLLAKRFCASSSAAA